MTTALKTVLSNTYTKSSLMSRMILLRQFLEYQFFRPHQNSNLFYLINDYFSAEKISRDEFNAFTLWDYEFFNQFNRENFYARLESLEKESDLLPLVGVFLPFHPPIYEIPRLALWLRKNVSGETLMDLKFDQSLIGGCALVWRGVYHDFSLRYFIEKYKPGVKNEIEQFLQARKEVPLV